MRLRLIFWMIAGVLGFLQAFGRPIPTGPDLVSYLDIADAYFRGDFAEALNSYWSPLYSWLLGFIRSVAQPSPDREFAAVKAVNFLIFVGAIACFEFFLRSSLAFYRRRNESLGGFFLSDRVWIVAGYTVFLWASIQWNGVHVDTPDLSTAAFVYLAAGCLLRIHSSHARLFHYGLLGAALGAGYLSKAVLFPLSFVFLMVCAVSARKQSGGRRGTLLAVCVFLLVSMPFCIVLSAEKGRLTFGDSGKLNYAWFVSPGFAGPTNWQGAEALHPTRKIFSDPEAFEFAAPVGGTYPPWYDPAYWWEGWKTTFDLSKQGKIIAKNLHYYARYFFGALSIGYLLLLIAGRGLLRSLRRLPHQWPLWIPALSGLAIFLIGTDLYAIHIDVQPGTRYVSSFIVLLFVSMLSSVSFPAESADRKGIAYLVAAYLALGWVSLSLQAVGDIRSMAASPRNPPWHVAEQLQEAGIDTGDQVAIIGDEDDHVYWARLAGVRIMAQVPDSKQFQLVPSERKLQLLRTLQSAGAAVVIRKTVLEDDPAGIWKRAGVTDYSICILGPLFGDAAE